MKKIFTDADIWDKEWFLDLPVKLKILWKYLTDNCDQAGVWEVNYRLASFSIGEKISHEDVLSFGDRIIFIDDKKALIVGRVNFQCGILNEYCNAHKPVLKALSRHGLKQDSVSGDVFKEIKEPFGNPSELVPNPSELVPNPSGVVQSHLGSLQEEEEEKEEGEKITASNVIQLWDKNVAVVGGNVKYPGHILGATALNDFAITSGYPNFTLKAHWEAYFQRIARCESVILGDWIVALPWAIKYENAVNVLSGAYDKSFKKKQRETNPKDDLTISPWTGEKVVA